MGKWLLGQGSLMVILGVTSTIVFVSLHMRYAYALGVLTGLLNIIPVLGAVVSLVLAVLVAALDSWGRVVGGGYLFCRLSAGGELIYYAAHYEKPGRAAGAGDFCRPAAWIGAGGRCGRTGFSADRGCWWRCWWMSILVNKDPA